MSGSGPTLRVDDDPTSSTPDPRLLLLVAAGLTIAVVVLLLLERVDPVASLVWSVDRSLHRAARNAETPVGVVVAQVLAVLGGVYVTAPLRVLVGVSFALMGRWRWVCAWIASIAIAEVVVTVMKAAIDRPRPPTSLEVAGQAAFPSGHVAAIAVTVVTLLLLLAPPRRARWWWLAGGVAIALMAAGRVYLRVHWSSDAVMGALVGAAAAVLAVGSCAFVADRRRERPRGVRLRGRMMRRRRS